MQFYVGEFGDTPGLMGLPPLQQMETDICLRPEGNTISMRKLGIRDLPLERTKGGLLSVDLLAPSRKYRKTGRVAQALLAKQGKAKMCETV